ncbi:MAG TPA: hypothetical protein VFC04_01270 [Actinomycetota bacterium]|nr:hypothetical protein [Actinomycetota bacterium]
MTAARAGGRLSGLGEQAGLLLRRGIYEAKTIVARYPALAIPIARRRHGVPVGDDTRIVIEGFPRTGTSFAVAAFDIAQGRSVRVACHVHAPAQVLEGVRRGLPTLVIVREPEDTVLSFVIRNPHIGLRQALRGYLRFYEPLLPVRDRVVVGRFADVTTDFGGVIRRVNERFGTSFVEFEHTQESARRVFEEIEGDYRGRLPEGEALERQVARPSEWRRRVKAELASAYRAPATRDLRARAERAFGALVDDTGA